VGVAALGVALVLLGGGVVPVVVAAMVGIGSALVLLDTLGRTWLQGLTADGTTGRAFGALNTVAALWLIAGSTLPALLVPVLGLQATLAVLAAAVTVLGTVALAPGVGRRAPASGPDSPPYVTGAATAQV
jgi:hypothetical protein